MPSNTATNISTIFRDRVITELIYLLISAAMVSMMFRRLIWIHIFYHFWLFVCITSFYLSLTVILTSHFSNITYFRQQQQQNKPMKCYEIWPTHTEIPRNTTRKIANLYIEFNYHFLTLQKKSHYFWTGVYKEKSMMVTCVAESGHLFTKRTDVLPQDLVKPRGREIHVQTFPITLKFDRHLGSSAAEMPVKFQSNTITLTPYLSASRLHEISRQDVRLLSE